MKSKSKILMAAWAAMAFVLAGSVQAGLALTNALVVHLTFDNTYNDSSGNGNNGAPVNAPTFTAGKIGSAVHLTTKSDGSVTNTVTLGYPAQLKFGSDAGGDTTDFSISFWVKILAHQADQAFIASKDWDSGSNLGWVINNEDDGLKWNWKDDLNGRRDSPHVAPLLENTNWHNVVVTFVRKGNGSIYVDGALVDQSTIAPDVVGGVANAVGSVDTESLGFNINVGDDGKGNYAIRDTAGMDLLMDDLGIWRRALSAVEAASIYAGGLAGQDLGSVTVKIPPRVQSVSPTPNTTAAAGNTAISAMIQDADTAVATNTVQLIIDGTAVPPTISKSTNGITTVTYLPLNLFAPNSTHTAKLNFSDNGTPANQVTTNWSFSVLNYGTLPPAFAQALNAVDKNVPGFKVRSSQIDSTANGVLPGQNIAHAEAQLAGLLTDPATGAAYANAAGLGPLPDGSFSISNVLNLSFDGTDQGNFNSANGHAEGAIPGITGNANADNMAVEILTYLQLPAGYYRFGVSSSDGFRVTAGLDARSAFATQLGVFDTYRITSRSTSTFDFAVQQTGYYFVRIVWFRHSNLPDNSSSTGAFEFFTVSPTGEKILVNDTSNPQAVLAFQNSTTVYPPYVKYAGPTAFISDYRGADFGLKTVQVQISDGTSAKVDSASVKLSIDGTAVTPAVTNSSGVTTLTYTPAGLQLPRTIHNGQLVFATQGSGTRTTNTWQFNGLRNYVLPAPLYFENFDSTPLSTIPPPTNWVAENHTGHQHPGEDPTDLLSDFFLGWVVLDQTDAPGKVQGVAPNQELNGVVIDGTVNTLMSNNFLYAESDARQNGPPGQIQYLTTPRYDLSGKTGIVVAFNSSYEQNQDALACLECSVDGGTNWSPVFYWVQGDADSQAPSDILRDANGNVDAVATMTTTYGDVARYTDPTGALVGGFYGFFIRAPITQALAPYIEGRVNDDGSESKRVELFRVAVADNKANVRFRFVQAGTSSWYWGVDNWGIYSVPSVIVTPANLGTLTGTLQGGKAVLSWTGGANIQLQSTTSLTPANWQPVAGTQGGGSYTNAISGNVYYRLIQQ